MALSKKHETLVKAVRSGNLQKVQSLLLQGYHPDPEALHEAVKTSHLLITKVLVEAGANVNRQDDSGMTPLDISRRRDFSDDPEAPAVIRYLKSQGALSGGYLRQQLKKSKTTMKKPHIRLKKGRGFSGADSEVGDIKPIHKLPPVKFTEGKLKDIFNPESWIGKTNEMKKLWADVPAGLKEKFDFESALADATRQTIRRNYPPSRTKLGKKPG